MTRSTAALLVCLAASCATISKPCQEGGDVAWDWGVGKQAPRGNRQCLQIQDKTGTWVNHGRYVVWFPGGESALEGAFKDGLKEGKWTQYDEKGKKVTERMFEKGVEVKEGAPREPDKEKKQD